MSTSDLSVRSLNMTGSMIISRTTHVAIKNIAKGKGRENYNLKYYIQETQENFNSSPGPDKHTKIRH